MSNEELRPKTATELMMQHQEINGPSRLEILLKEFDTLRKQNEKLQGMLDKWTAEHDPAILKLHNDNEELKDDILGEQAISRLRYLENEKHKTQLSEAKAKLLILKMLWKIRSQRKKLRWIHCSNSVEEYAELRCANEALIEVLKMAVPQKPSKKTSILKTEGGEESEALLIPKEEVESVLSRYGYQKDRQ